MSDGCIIRVEELVNCSGSVTTLTTETTFWGDILMRKRIMAMVIAGILMVIGAWLHFFVPTTPFPILDMTVAITATVFFWGGVLFFAAGIFSDVG